VIDERTLSKAIARIVVAATGLPANKVSIENNFSAPDGSYCKIRLQNPMAWGQAMKSQRDAVAADDPQYMDIIDQTRTQLDLSFSVNFYRDNAISYASALLEANKRIPIKTILRANRMGWIRTTAVNNLTGLFSGNQEERSQLDVHVYHEDLVEDRVNRIYRVEYAVEDENLNVLAQGQVNGLSG
jgi:hypothetical protein